jgi:TonB family protein
MKYICFTLMLALGSTGISAQQLDARTISKIKVKFINANNFFEAKDYDKALQKISEVEALLGKPSATALNLKIKIMVARGQYVKAEQVLDKLYDLSPNGKVLEDIAVYSTVIEENIERARRRIEAEKLAQKQRDKQAAEYAEQQRIIQIEKDKNEAIAKKNEQLAQVQKQQWINEISTQCVNAEQCYALSQKLKSENVDGNVLKISIQRYASTEKSCDLNLGVACFDLANLYVNKYSVDLHYNKLLEKGCDLQYANSCFKYASLLDASHSKDFYEKACELNHKKSCDYLVGLRHVVRIEPKYPREAALGGIEGWVKLSFTINEYGGVADVNVIDAHPNDIFNKAAKRALVKWKYRPKVVDGITVKQTDLMVHIDFKLN